MAYEETLRRISLPMGTGVPFNPFELVYVDSNGNASVAAQYGRISGVVQDNNGTASGLYSEVGINGVSKVLVGSGGCTAGTLAMSDGSGNAINWDGNSLHNIVGQFLLTGNQGDVQPMLLKVL